MIGLGAVIFLTGLLIRMVSIRHMGKFNLAISMPERIKTDGIYGIVRHPSYVGSIVMFIGLAVLSIHIALIYFIVVFYLSRAIQEEVILRNLDSYKEYIMKTGMFFPKVCK